MRLAHTNHLFFSAEILCYCGAMSLCVAFQGFLPIEAQRHWVTIAVSEQSRLVNDSDFFEDYCRGFILIVKYSLKF